MEKKITAKAVVAAFVSADKADAKAFGSFSDFIGVTGKVMVREDAEIFEVNWKAFKADTAYTALPSDGKISARIRQAMSELRDVAGWTIGKDLTTITLKPTKAERAHSAKIEAERVEAEKTAALAKAKADKIEADKLTAEVTAENQKLHAQAASLLATNPLAALAVLPAIVPTGDTKGPDQKHEVKNLEKSGPSSNAECIKRVALLANTFLPSDLRADFAKCLALISAGAQLGRTGKK